MRQAEKGYRFVWEEAVLRGKKIEARKIYSEKNVATKIVGRGGGKAFVAGPLKKITFLRLP